MISNLAKPEIKGRGFIGSGNNIIEVQTYFTQPEHDWVFDEDQKLTYNNPVFTEQCKIQNKNWDELNTGWVEQKPIDDEEEEIEEDEDEFEDDDFEDDEFESTSRFKPSDRRKDEMKDRERDRERDRARERDRDRNRDLERDRERPLNPNLSMSNQDESTSNQTLKVPPKLKLNKKPTKLKLNIKN